MTDLVIIAFPDVEELDLTGPWEVFGVARMLDPSFTLTLAAASLDPVRCSKGQRLLPDQCFDQIERADVLLVPGGQGTRRLIHDRPTLDFIARIDRTSRFTTSVCTGAFLLGAAVVTHHQAREELRALALVGEVVAGPRFLVKDKLVTAAGVSAGIDMALWLIGQLRSPAFARRVQDHMEYYPAPPYGDTAAA